MGRVLFLGFALAAVCVAAATASVRTPSLTIVRSSPLVVRGAGFRAHELVSVTASGKRVRVRATSRGAFLATLPQVDRCSGGRIVALGATGEQVVLRLPQPLCAPASPA